MAIPNNDWQVTLKQATFNSSEFSDQHGHDQATLTITSHNEALLEKTKLFLELMRHRLNEVDEKQMRDLIEAAMPFLQSSQSPEALRQTKRNVDAREALLNEFGVLTSEEVHDLAGSRAGNKSAMATRWRKEGRIFAIDHRGRTYFPAFQFDNAGRPLPAIAKVIEHLGADETGWQLALWFITNNGWLGGRRPVDLLESEPEAVVDVASQEAASDAF